jgi:chemotaxis protein methyltransferase CheR
MNRELDDELYARFRDLLLARCGLYYPQHRRADLSHGLHQVLAATQHQNLRQLYADVIAGGPAWEVVLAQLTIGETYFFRNSAQFDALREHIFPELIARRSTQRVLRLWSAGCATGEEPYSLAMLLGDLLPAAHGWGISILATDINPDFLARAREALYGNWSFRETPQPLRDRFWDAEQGRWRLQPAIRQMVHFARLNLAEPSYPAIANGTAALDLIVCRNVTIYFDEATTRHVITRFYNALTPGGWLIVGHAEPQASMYQQFEVHNFPNTVVYRKPLDAPLFGFDRASGTFSAGGRPILQPGMRVGQIAAGTLAGAPAPRPAVVQNIETKRGGTAPLARPAATPPVGRAADLWPAIEARLAQGDKAGAEIQLNELLCIAPGHAQARIALGRLYADRGEWPGAEQQCLLALEQDALCIPAHHLLGQIHEHQGQLDAALAAYRRALYLDQHFVPAMLGIAGVWRRLGRAANAQRTYRNALSHLSALPTAALVPGGEGATAGDLLALVRQQLAALG